MTKKLLVHLRDDQHTDLAQHWVETGQSMNETVRKGVDLIMDKIKKVKAVKKNKGEL